MAALSIRLYYAIIGDRTLARSDWVLATSNYYAKHSRHLAQVRQKVSIATCGVDTHVFHLRKHLDNALQVRLAGQKVVLFVGSMDASHNHKGLDILIRSMATVGQRNEQPCVLVIVGKGNAIDRYKELAALVGAKTLFFGEVSEDVLAQLYSVAKVCVLPSTNKSEGLGMVLLEAGACGAPVIGSRVGGIPHAIVNGETGLLVSPGDQVALADAISELLLDEDRARRLGEAGMRRVTADFSWEDSAAATNNALVNAVDRIGRSR